MNRSVVPGCAGTALCAATIPSMASVLRASLKCGNLTDPGPEGIGGANRESSRRLSNRCPLIFSCPYSRRYGGYGNGGWGSRVRRPPRAFMAPEGGLVPTPPGSLPGGDVVARLSG